MDVFHSPVFSWGKGSQVVGADTPELGPEQIRALRGGLSRAAFARQVGVTPLTVYRWELPDSAPQARRPRGRVAKVLRQLAQQGRTALPSPSPARAGGRAPEPLLPEEREPLLACISHLQRAEWRAAEDGLLDLLASDTLRTRGSRAQAAVGLAFAYRWGAEDARRAFTVLLPHLAEADAGLLPPQVELQVHTTAAHLFASPDGRLFDVGKVNAHVARAEALLGHAYFPAELRCLLRLAELAAAFYQGEPELIARQYGRVDEVLAEVTDPVIRLLAEDGRAHEASIRGEARLATRRFREVAQTAARMSYPFMEARHLAYLAQRRLEEACEPDEALTLVRRAREVAWNGRLPRGYSFMVAARVEAEALLRLARFAEAEAALDAGDAVLEGLSWSPYYAMVVTRMRLLWVTGRPEELRRLAARLAGYTGPIQRAIIHAYALYVEAMADFREGGLPRAARGLAQAHAQVMEAGGWPYLRRDCLIMQVCVLALVGQLEEARAALSQARRILERLPSAWSTALLHRHEGMLLAREGRMREAREKLETSLATFSLAGDISEAAINRYVLALVAHTSHAPGAEARLAHSTEELRHLGLAPPSRALLEVLQGQPHEVMAPPGAPRLGTEALVVPFERLSVRGMGTSLIQRELLAVVEGLLPGRSPRLVELDAQASRKTLLLGDANHHPTEWVEFSDGCGRQLCLGVTAPLTEEERAVLTALTRLSGFALEVAALRGFAQAEEAVTHEHEDAPEVPGFIAASPSMRRLKVELAGLSASRATVIITGESGSGKEVVAKALHRLSARASRPYVAFNCAAVPRELFEGQLFGYRRGSFTGAALDHPGVIRAAHGGTLFLDEIGELPLEVQPKLLRFLENGEVFPLGETRPVHVDVRVVAATHRDLGLLVREGRFREDLYYRLQVVPIRVPPLRERREDIIALARHFVNHLTPEGAEPPRLGPDALAVLTAHPWPGNVRELRNVIERSLAFGPLPKLLGAGRLRLEG